MQYFTVLTKIGARKIAAATALKKSIALTSIALGDGNGKNYLPNENKTRLENEVFKTDLNDLKVDEKNSNWVVAEAYVPSNKGNFWVREVGVFDSEGDLIAIGNYPETYKPITVDGVAKDLYIKVIFEVSSLESVSLNIDPSVVLATREFVQDQGLSILDTTVVNGNQVLKNSLKVENIKIKGVK